MNATDTNTKTGEGPNTAQNQTGKEKQWWEQLAGTVPGDKEGQKTWWKFFTHPLTIIIGLVILGYRWSSKQEARYKTALKENEELKTEIARLRKKYKKLKKKKQSPSAANGKPKRPAVLD